MFHFLLLFLLPFVVNKDVQYILTEPIAARARHAADNALSAVDVSFVTRRHPGNSFHASNVLFET